MHLQIEVRDGRQRPVLLADPAQPTLFTRALSGLVALTWNQRRRPASPWPRGGSGWHQGGTGSARTGSCSRCSVGPTGWAPRQAGVGHRNEQRPR